MEEKIQAQYMVVSFSHKNVDISTREALSIKDKHISAFLADINAIPDICESILLCTCNRVELYVSMYDKKIAREHIYKTFAQYSSLSIERVRELALLRLNEYAIYHIFGVASSLDSLVIGETQITGQLKSAYKNAFDGGFCGKDMTRLMHFAFKCAANVRKQTDISSQSVSVASTAVYMAEQKLKQNGQNIESMPVLVIGSGEMGRLLCKHLLHLKADITLISRTYKNAKALSAELTPHSIHIESYADLPTLLNDFHLIFSATSASGYIITQTMIDSIPAQNMPRYYFDLALPRDIESSTRADVQVFCVDDLEQVVKEHKNIRAESAKEARKIVERFTADFFKWLQTLSIEPVIKHIRYLAKESAHKELERAVKKGFLPEQYRDNVEKILHGAFNTFLHQPTQRLRQASESHHGDPIIEAMKSMFDIGDDIMMLNSYKCEKDTTF